MANGSPRQNIDTSPRRLTESEVKGLELNGHPYVIRDTKVPGFMVGVNCRSKMYKLQVDLWGSEGGKRVRKKTVRRTLGSVEEMSLKDARAQAQGYISQIKQGTDPWEEPKPQGEELTVGHMYAEYVEELKRRCTAERSWLDVENRTNHYLSDWQDLPLRSITRRMVREKFKELTNTCGAKGSAANKVFKDFRAAYELILQVEEEGSLPANPTRSITRWNPTPSRDVVILPEELPAWWTKLQARPNPLRRLMHEFGLFSGLRPGNLRKMRKEWINMEGKGIKIPSDKMKSRRDFAVPLSAHMEDVLRRALDLSEVMFPGSPWVFPTRRPNGEVGPTTNMNEPGMKEQTAHVLRHTYMTLSTGLVGVDPDLARLLTDHKIPGVRGVYIHERALFDRLLVAQQRMSAEILRLLAPSKNHC